MAFSVFNYNSHTITHNRALLFSKKLPVVMLLLIPSSDTGYPKFCYTYADKFCRRAVACSQNSSQSSIWKLTTR